MRGRGYESEYEAGRGGLFDWFPRHDGHDERPADIADMSRSVFALALMVGLGVLVGFQFHCTALAAAAAMALVIAFGYAFSWVFAAIALIVKDPETAQVVSVLPFFILMFASSA